jgi:hypothetical protein
MSTGAPSIMYEFQATGWGKEGKIKRHSLTFKETS